VFEGGMELRCPPCHTDVIREGGGRVKPKYHPESSQIGPAGPAARTPIVCRQTELTYVTLCRMSRHASSSLALGLVLASGVAACMRPKAGNDEVGEGSGCVDGQAGCACYGNGTCDEDLVCTEDLLCVPLECSEGVAGCPCYGNGTCDAGLTCSAFNLCEPEGSESDSTSVDSTTDSESSSGAESTDSTGSTEDTGSTDSTGETTSGGDPCMDVPDDMVCVTAGTFEMGTDLAMFLGFPVEQREKPAHEVTISQTFWLDETEVTAAAYAECWGAQACTIPSLIENPYPTWAVPGKENHPINGVNWHQARAYCEWKGKRLPSEAEWEYAARGDDGRMYTWGNEAPTCQLMVGSDCGQPPGTFPVGSTPAGASPFGALDMIGNVLEWCEDYYQEDYYYVSPSVDPKGPDSGTTRSFRAAVSYVQSTFAWARATDRYGYSPTYSNHTTGFRCAQDPP